MRASWTASATLAISISFRIAASGSLNGLCSANFTGFVLGVDVRDVNQGVLQAVTIKHLAAGAAHHGAGLLRWQLFASCPHFIFARGPVALIAPCPKVSLRSVCQKYLPRGFEVGTGLVERGSSAALVFARMRPGIETAMPFPRILVMRDAAADRDRASVHVPVVMCQHSSRASVDRRRVSSGMPHQSAARTRRQIGASKRIRIDPFVERGCSTHRNRRGCIGCFRESELRRYHLLTYNSTKMLT